MKPLIAIIEDGPDNQVLIQAILEEHYECAAFLTGEEALQQMLLRLPRLALVDIALPGIDGVEVLRQMRKHVRLKHIPAIAVTSHAMSTDREKYLSLGFNAYVPKPIWDDQLLLQPICNLLAHSP